VDALGPETTTTTTTLKQERGERRGGVAGAAGVSEGSSTYFLPCSVRV